MTLKLFVVIQSCCMPRYIVLGSMVPELHDMRIFCLLKAVSPARVTNTVSFTVVIDYTRYYDSFEILQVKVKSHLSVGPARAINKHYSARRRPINPSFMCVTQGW